MDLPPTTIPSSFRAWQYTSIKGGIEKNLKLNTTSLRNAKAGEHLVQVLAVALNPVDYKPAEVPLIHRLIIPKVATPGIDVAARIVTPARDSALQPGQLVFGTPGSNPLAAGGLAEYVAMPQEYCVPVPDGVGAVDAASIPVAGLTAYQSISPHVKSGNRVFINGGSGGTGTFGIQFAKALGCNVTVTCSSANVDLCKSLGASEVIDYTQSDVLQSLKAMPKFDHVVDNVGKNFDLYWIGHEYMNENATYIMVAGETNVNHFVNSIKAKRLPTFLGGGKRKYSGFWPKPNKEDLATIATWMKEGKVKAVIDSTWRFEDAAAAFEKLKTGRAKGKIVVKVNDS